MAIAGLRLWKLSSADEPGWDSPWGRGRPGWHIECSAMSKRYLGEVFDIHGGGLDLIFPHHENEIAQSRCAHGTEVMANIWMHNGFLQVEGQKMSKSLGSFFTISELLADWPGEVLRFNMLRTHYRQPIDWTISSLKESERIVTRWLSMVDDFHGDLGQPLPRVVDALKDDLNTPLAIASLHEFMGLAFHETAESRKPFLAALQLFGLDFRKFKDRDNRAGISSDERKRAEQLISAREVAKKVKQFSTADRIRDELAAMGIAIKDNKDGTTSWEVKR